jgi:hypothetical protein
LNNSGISCLLYLPPFHLHFTDSTSTLLTYSADG